MAGLLPKIIIHQKPYVSKYTQSLLTNAEKNHGQDSSEYKGIFNQYFRMPQVEQSNGNNARHYESEMSSDFPKGLERLYKRVVVIDLLTACASECVYCLRGYYEPFTLSKVDITQIADYLSQETEIQEVLITGGDPFVSPKNLKMLLSTIASSENNIRFARIGTRYPVQSPEKFDRTLFEFFNSLKDELQIEIGCQINHPYELQTITCDIFNELSLVGCNIYSQNVLLRGVNDSVSILSELYDQLRSLRIDPHYLFHAIPLKRTDEFRTTVEEGLDLINELTSCGEISGRAKPMYALMTDIGKVVLYHNSIEKRENGRLLIKTHYRLDKRRQWNPGYNLPKTASLNEDGTMSVYYLDGQHQSDTRGESKNDFA